MDDEFLNELFYFKQENLENCWNTCLMSTSTIFGTGLRDIVCRGRGGGGGAHTQRLESSDASHERGYESGVDPTLFISMG